MVYSQSRGDVMWDGRGCWTAICGRVLRCLWYRWCRFPFIACEIFTCEIDVIFKTLVEDEEVQHRNPDLKQYHRR
jgi:hypothetical protein